MSKQFILPAPGNSITEKDIDKGYLRITVDFKEFFPSSDRTIQITIADRQRPVSFKFKDSRSHLLKIGRQGMDELRIKEGDRVQVDILNNYHYKLSKV